MHDAVLVSEVERIEHLQHELHRLDRCDLVPAIEHVAERLALQMLHHHERVAVTRMTEVVKPDDARMTELGRRTGLMQKALAGLFLPFEVGVQELDGDVDLEERIRSEPDGAHAARAEHALQPVLAGHDLALAVEVEQRGVSIFPSWPGVAHCFQISPHRVRLARMAFVRSRSFWIALAVTAAAGCTAIANGHLSDKPNEGTGGGEGGSGATGGDAEGGSIEAPKQALGTPCENNPDCASGSCTDGVCCDQACVGGCVSCNQFGLYGTCVPLIGAPGDCDNGELCGGDGMCTPVDGEGCANDTECTTGFCTDGVCCNERCDDDCESCLGAETDLVDGICALTIGELANECTGSECIAKGQCCGDGQDPVGSGCPAVCNGGCAGGTCTIQCPSDGCKSTNISCPAGFDCHVECQDLHSCRDSTIDCPPDHACEVTCGGGVPEHGCENTVVTCTNGPCSLTCVGPDDPCKGTKVTCGTNACDITCDGNKPAVTCGESCRCDGCG